MPSNMKIFFVNNLIKGICDAAKLCNVDVVGGDTVSSPSILVISVSVIGRVSRKNLVFRKGARVGDKILVTGRLGGSKIRKQFDFIPRIKEAQWLVKNGKINSMMDITDGLLIDLKKILNINNVGAILYKDKIPISKDAIDSADPLARALSDGEDFELLVISRFGEALIKKWLDKKRNVY